MANLPKIPNIALIIVGLLAVAFLLMKPKSQEQPEMASDMPLNLKRDTINITTGQDSVGQLLVPTGGLNIAGGSITSAGKTIMDAKCDCNTSIPGQCCWTGQVISERHQNEPQTIGPYCSVAKNCDEVKAKFLGQNQIELNFANLAYERVPNLG